MTALSVAILAGDQKCHRPHPQNGDITYAEHVALQANRLPQCAHLIAVSDRPLRHVDAERVAAGRSRFESIRAAMEAPGADYVLLVSGDLPDLNTEALAALLNAIGPEPEHDAYLTYASLEACRRELGHDSRHPLWIRETRHSSPIQVKGGSVHLVSRLAFSRYGNLVGSLVGNTKDILGTASRFSSLLGLPILARLVASYAIPALAANLDGVESQLYQAKQLRIAFYQCQPALAADHDT